MSYIIRILLLIIFPFFCSFVHALESKILNEIDLTWLGSPDEVRVTFISGNEESNGMYLYRVKFPKGHKILPHFHSDERVVTVLRGSLYVGYGRKFEETTMKKLIEGGFWTEPKEKAHYVWAKDGEVELQVVGYGPSTRSNVN